MSEQSDPLVTFIVPCYNYGRYLGECLQSIYSQQGEHSFEIIAIDDASTDNTQEVLRSFADDRLCIITHSTNQGHARTINEGLRAARGRFVARIDPDDRYRPSFLSTVLEKFARYPDVGLVYGDAAQIDGSGRVTVPSSDTVHSNQDYRGNEFIALLDSNFICAPTVIARREAWLQAGPVPTDLAFNDWYFTLMMAREWNFYYVNHILADYRVHGTNHHSTIVRNKTEEPSLFWMLDKIFNEVERDERLEHSKRRVRHRIYASHYVTLADKYFGFGMDADARRCYLRALRHQPTRALHAGVLRHLLGALMGRKPYTVMKASFKRLIACLQWVRHMNLRDLSHPASITESRHRRLRVLARLFYRVPGVTPLTRTVIRLAIQRLPLRLTNRQRLYNFFAVDVSPNRSLQWRARTAPGRSVRVIFDPGDDLSRQWYYWGYSGYEPATTALLSTLLPSRSCVLDVGANIGYYTLLAASLLDGHGHVHAFEPAPDIFRSLLDNASINHFPHLKLNQVAVSDVDGVETLFVPSDPAARTNASLVPGFMEQVSATDVPSVRLDTYCSANRIERVELIHIDVEGAEVRVLQGMGAFLHRWLPDIICEVLQPYEDEMDKFLASMPYRKFLITDRGLVEMGHIQAHSRYRDFYFSCAPNERLARRVS